MRVQFSTLKQGIIHYFRDFYDIIIASRDNIGKRLILVGKQSNGVAIACVPGIGLYVFNLISDSYSI